MSTPETPTPNQADRSVPTMGGGDSVRLDSPEAQRSKELYYDVPDEVKERMEDKVFADAQAVQTRAQELADQRHLEMVRNMIKHSGVEWSQADQDQKYAELSERGAERSDYRAAKADIDKRAEAMERLRPNFEAAEQAKTLGAETVAELREHQAEVLDHLRTEAAQEDPQHDSYEYAANRLAAILRDETHRPVQVEGAKPVQSSMSADTVGEYLTRGPVNRIRRFFKGNAFTKVAKGAAVVGAVGIFPIAGTAAMGYAVFEAGAFSLWALEKRSRQQRRDGRARSLAGLGDR